jgi:hypothetical protein
VSIGGSFSSMTIDATNDAAEFLFQAEEDATITHLGFRYTSKGAGTPPLYTIALKDVTSSGVPGSTTYASGTFTPPNDTSWDGTFQWVALSASYAVARGTLYAITISTAGTPNSDQFTLTMGATANFPLAILNNAGSRTDQTVQPIYGYRSSSKRYGNPIQSFNTAVSYNSGSTPDERGIVFTLDAGVSDTFNVLGVNTPVTVASTTLGINFSLETTGGTVLQSENFPKGAINTASARGTSIYFDESTLADLAFGTKYYLWIGSDNATSITIRTLGFASADDAAAVCSRGAFASVTRTDGGAATEDATTLILADLIISDITEAAGGGGTSVFLVEG